MKPKKKMARSWLRNWYIGTTPDTYYVMLRWVRKYRNQR